MKNERGMTRTYKVSATKLFYLIPFIILTFVHPSFHIFISIIINNFYSDQLFVNIFQSHLVESLNNSKEKNNYSIFLKKKEAMQNEVEKW